MIKVVSPYIGNCAKKNQFKSVFISIDLKFLQLWKIYVYLQKKYQIMANPCHWILAKHNRKLCYTKKSYVELSCKFGLKESGFYEDSSVQILLGEFVSARSNSKSESSNTLCRTPANRVFR